MKTSYPKNKIKAVLVEGVHPAGIAVLRDEGFQVETLAGAPDVANAARASPSNTMNRHGASLPWSGTREAIVRIVSSSAALGPPSGRMSVGL